MISHLGLGGAERVCFELMRGLGADHAFAVYAPLGVDPDRIGRGMRDELAELRIPVHVGAPLRFSRGGLAVGAARFPTEVLGCRPDLIHLHTEVPEAAYAVARRVKRRLRGIPIVRTIHNSVYWPEHRAIGRWCARQLAEAHIAAVSQSALSAFDELQRAAHAGTPRSRRIIANGVRVVRAKPPAVRSGSLIRVLFAGRLERQKGADLLPQIVRATRLPSGIAVELQIYGHGSEEPAVRALAAAPPAGWTIRLDAPIADLPVRLADHDLLVMPSRFEGLSILAMEGLASGLPIVATTAPGLREGFPTDYPWLAPPADPAAFATLLSRALASPGEWPRVAEQGRAFATARFTAAAMCEAYRELYVEALRGSATHAARIASAATSKL